MKKWFAKLTLVGFGLLAALLIAEITLRILGFSSPQFYRVDPYSGASLRPGAEGLWNKEGRSYVVINAHGLRDREYTLKKNDGAIRIAILGDSYAEAFQLPMKQAFWSVLENELKNCNSLSGLEVEIINFGVSGYGTAQQLQTLRYRVWDYDPDIVILAFLTGNDVRNNHRALERDPVRPYFQIIEGQLRLDKSYLLTPEYLRNEKLFFVGDMINYSRFLQLLNSFRRTFAHWREQQKNGLSEVVSAGFEGEEMGLDDYVYLPPENRVWKEAWLVTEKLIQTMNREVTERGKIFLFATLSNGIQVNPDAEKREKFCVKTEVDDLFYPDKRLAAMARKQGIAHLTLAPQLLDWASQSDTCVHGFDNANLCGGHWNKYGHEVAGKLMAEKVCEMLMQ